MVFSTSLFIFSFLPVFLAIYYLTPWRGKSAVILAGSYLFYGWWRVEYLALIFVMSLVSWLAARGIAASEDASRRKRLLWLGVGLDLAALGFFKYATFFGSNLEALNRMIGGSGFDVPDILLPIGISFHTFQSISYIVDVYRKDAPPARRLVDFLAFGSLFPQLIAGPVLRYKDLADQFAYRVHSLDLFNAGVRRFTTGLAMKVLIADSVAPLADRIFALPNPTFAEAWLGALAYTFQLFFDFAGYSAMAIGMGLMIGFRFIENFNAPYISRSITEFWRRWHISLSTWLRDYLYIPLGGNRRGARRTYINLVTTMVLGGLWHGANWTFVLWGLWHGVLMAVERAMGAKHSDHIWPKQIAWPLTFAFVVIGWVIFRATSVGDALSMYEGMIGLNGFALRPEVAWAIRGSELLCLVIAMAVCWSPRLRRIEPGTALTVVLLFLAITRMIAQGNSPFLYFQF